MGSVIFLHIYKRRINKSEAKDLHKKWIAESQELADLAVKRKACGAGEIVVPDTPDWVRIMRPIQKDQPVCVVLYDLDMVEDGKITDDALVSTFYFCCICHPDWSLYL